MYRLEDNTIFIVPLPLPPGEYPERFPKETKMSSIDTCEKLIQQMTESSFWT